MIQKKLMLSHCLPQHPIFLDHLNVFPLNTIPVIFQQDILWSNFHVMTDRASTPCHPPGLMSVFRVDDTGLQFSTSQKGPWNEGEHEYPSLLVQALWKLPTPPNNWIHFISKLYKTATVAIKTLSSDTWKFRKNNKIVSFTV